MQKIFAELSPRGLNLVAVNWHDSADVIKKYVRESGLTFTTVMNGEHANDIASNYGVSAFPTNYVISPDGKVVARFIGFDEGGIRQALKRLGVE